MPIPGYPEKPSHHTPRGGEARQAKWGDKTFIMDTSQSPSLPILLQYDSASLALLCRMGRQRQRLQGNVRPSPHLLGPLVQASAAVLCALGVPWEPPGTWEVSIAPGFPLGAPSLPLCLPCLGRSWKGQSPSWEHRARVAGTLSLSPSMQRGGSPSF